MKHFRFRFWLFLIFVGIFCVQTSCSGVDTHFVDSTGNYRYFPVEFLPGLTFETTKVFSSEETNSENQLIRVCRFDKYRTKISVVDIEGTPVAGEIHYIESNYEAQVGETSTSQKRGELEGKTIIFKPANQVSIDGKHLNEEESFGFRLIGFDYLFLPEKLDISSSNVFELPESRLRELNHFLRLFKVLPDASRVAVKLAKESKTDLSSKKDIWIFDIHWEVSALIVGKNPKGIKMNLAGKLKYSATNKGIVYFELKKTDSDKNDSSFNIIVNRQFYK